MRIKTVAMIAALVLGVVLIGALRSNLLTNSPSRTNESTLPLSGSRGAADDRSSDGAKPTLTPQLDGQAASSTSSEPLRDSGRVFAVADFLVNPYIGERELVTLDVLPVGRRATVNFERMISEHVALFEVLAWRWDGDSEVPQSKGEIAVNVDSSDDIPSGDKGWVVEPLGVVNGTNRFGGPIQVAFVKFVRYSGKAKGELEKAWAGSGIPTGQNSIKVENIARPIVSVDQLLKNPYAHKGLLVILDVRPDLQERRGVYFNRMLSDKHALFDFNEGMTVTGKFIVVLDTSEEKLSTRNAWVVELMGVTGAENGLGAPTDVPTVAFRSYSEKLPESPFGFLQ